MTVTELEELQNREDELRSHAAFELGFPWMMDRELQLKWWARYGAAVMRYVVVKEAFEQVVRSRPPDRFRYVGEENSRSSHIERRHTAFKTWPVKVNVHKVHDLLGMSWDLPDGNMIGVKVPVNGRVYTSEEDVAGA